jgi:hypothetical protein
MSINTSDSNTACPFAVSTWNQYPGGWILDAAQTQEQTKEHCQKKAEVIFKQLINQRIPQAKQLITKLIDTKHLSPDHLPMLIYTIFLTYVNDQIELYQNQHEERDVGVDLEWHKFMKAFARERHALFAVNKTWIKSLSNRLTELLKKADVLPKDLETTMKVWEDLLCLGHVSDMMLVSLFEEKARSSSLGSKRGNVHTQLSRHQLESSFLITVRLLSTVQWITEKLEENMKLFLTDNEQEIFGKFKENIKPFLTSTQDAQQTFCSWQKNCTSVSDLYNDLLALHRNLLSLDLTNNEKIDSFSKKMTHIQDTLTENCESCGKIIGCLKNIDKAGKKPTILSNESFKPFLSLLKKMQKCNSLAECYIINPISLIVSILDGLQKSNTLIENHKKGGTTPPLASQSLLPPPRVYNEKFALELSNETPAQPKLKKKKIPSKSQSSAVNQPQKRPPEKPNQEKKTPPAQPTPKSATAINLSPPKNNNKSIAKLSPLEELREKLFALHSAKADVAIRQALWHIDALITLHHIFNDSSFQAKESLTILNRMASSAHKLLEQTYRFYLQQKGTPFHTHNLKEYHFTLYDSPCPDIVEKLYLANHWARYFYIEQQRWHALSTQSVCTPPLIEDLVCIAEGKLPSKEALKKRVDEIIEKTLLQVNAMLPVAKNPSRDSLSTKDVCLQVKKPMKVNVFDEVVKDMNKIKTSFQQRHPSLLYLKQGISALSMVQVSLQRLQKAKTPCELMTWTSQCLQQTHEAIENVLHAIEFFKANEVTTLHELQVLSEKIQLEIGPLGSACDKLSMKSRYPAEHLSEGLGAQIIDDIETLRHCPQCLDNFELVGPLPPILWKAPSSKTLSVDEIMEKLSKLIADSEEFLRTKALPALSAYTQGTQERQGH